MTICPSCRWGRDRFRPTMPSMKASASLDVPAHGRDAYLTELDQERRRQLRIFLVHARAGLRPSDVGLPHTTQRRVPGLRREEVAELIGVSCDWYRWFECGRPIRVSPRLLLRVVVALRLCEQQALTLYQLAIPEMYISTRRVHSGHPGVTHDGITDAVMRTSCSTILTSARTDMIH